MIDPIIAYACWAVINGQIVNLDHLCPHAAEIARVERNEIYLESLSFIDGNIIGVVVNGTDQPVSNLRIEYRATLNGELVDTGTFYPNSPDLSAGESSGFRYPVLPNADNIEIVRYIWR